MLNATSEMGTLRRVVVQSIGVAVIFVLLFGAVASSSARSDTTATAIPTQSRDGIPGPPVKWKSSLPSVGYATHVGVISPPRVVLDGVIYVSSQDTITALDVVTGRKLWSFAPDFGLALTEVAVTDNTILLGFAFRGDLVPMGGVPPAVVIAVDARTGMEKWSLNTHGGWVSNLVVEEDVVYFAANNDEDEVSIYGVKIATGNVQWVLPSPHGHYVSDITVDAETLYFLTSHYEKQINRTVYYVQSVDIRTRQVTWRIEAPEIDDIGMGLPSLTMADNLVYAAGAHSLYVLEATTGTLRWKFNVGPYKQHEAELYPMIRTTPVIVGGMMYLGVSLGSGAQDENGYYSSVEYFLLGLDAATGEEKWRFKLDSSIDIESSLTIADGFAYFTTSGVRGYTILSYLYAVDINSRSVKWRLDAGVESYFVPPLVVAQGTLFVGSSNTNPDVSYDLLYAISTAPTGMPRAGVPYSNMWFAGLVSILSMVFGASLLCSRQAKASQC